MNFEKKIHFNGFPHFRHSFKGSSNSHLSHSQNEENSNRTVNPQQRKTYCPFAAAPLRRILTHCAAQRHAIQLFQRTVWSFSSNFLYKANALYTIFFALTEGYQFHLKYVGYQKLHTYMELASVWFFVLSENQLTHEKHYLGLMQLKILYWTTWKSVTDVWYHRYWCEKIT